MKTKALFFDAGPVITLVMARLINVLPLLKAKYGGKFYITPAVHKELVERPISVKRFEFEALQVEKLMRDGILELYDAVPKKKVVELIALANGSFSLDGKTMDVIQSGEMESVATALEIGAEGVVMDERTLRLFIENNKEMVKLLENRFKKRVMADKDKMNLFSAALKEVTIIRSIELVGLAYKIGLLDGYVPEGKEGKEVLVDAVLWATKFNGCAVTEEEIEDLKNFLLK
ncbi:hypothetical protein HYX11_03245 [Candidatus Woesearchaeota archaeon]|nr:hypothetical protein [Candidatus Woesearchaeota archaeon]